MALFKAWRAGTEDKSKKKTFRTYSENDGGRAATLTQLGLVLSRRLKAKILWRGTLLPLRCPYTSTINFNKWSFVESTVIFQAIAKFNFPQ